VSRFLHYFPQRISACAFFAVGYMAAEGVSSMSLHEKIKQMVGYDAFAYQRFFIQPDAAAVIEKNVRPFPWLLSVICSKIKIELSTPP
jgi:hypothetical protein